MALDPIVLNLGSGGDSIASDNIGGVNYEIVKPMFGGFGSGTLVSTSDPMPVTDALGATAAKQDTGNTSLASIDTKLTTPTTIYNGKTTVATAGSRTTLAASQAVKSVTIKALSTNTGLIYVGDASVASTTGFQLSARDSISLDIANLNTVNIDSSVNGEGVTYIGIN